MEILVKVLIIAVVIIAVVGVVVKLTANSSSHPVTQAQAVANITTYLHDVYGTSANVTITNVTPSQYQGSWDILAGVITNGTTPCPSYFVLSFEYPFNTYNYRIQNNYTANCKVNEATIGSSPVAIAKSYSLNTSQVNDFVNQYGYSNIVTRASKINSQQINGNTYNDIWEVYYTAPTQTTSSIQVYLDSNGTLITAT